LEILSWRRQGVDWIDVIAEDELVERRLTRIKAGEAAVLIIRVGEEILAIGNQCTHQGAGLDRGVVKIAGSVRTVTCPAHGSIFRLDDGKAMRPPATKGLPAYDVKVEDERVWVRSRGPD
jgi:nitrite reductase/ring-hydroxylating ferredoxin subunit